MVCLCDRWLASTKGLLRSTVVLSEGEWMESGERWTTTMKWPFGGRLDRSFDALWDFCGGRLSHAGGLWVRTNGRGRSFDWGNTAAERGERQGRCRGSSQASVHLDGTI